MCVLVRAQLLRCRSSPDFRGFFVVVVVVLSERQTEDLSFSLFLCLFSLVPPAHVSLRRFLSFRLGKDTAIFFSVCGGMPWSVFLAICTLVFSGLIDGWMEGCSGIKLCGRETDCCRCLGLENVLPFRRVGQQELF